MDRRSFLRGAALLICAPAIVRASSLMPVKAWRDDGIVLRMAPHPIGWGSPGFGNLTFEDITNEALEWMEINVNTSWKPTPPLIPSFHP